jgi:protein tyrosine/serine phosphatase
VTPLRYRRAAWISASGASLALVVGSALWWHAHLLPRRFAVVDAGRLCRSGEVTPGQLARLQRDYGIRRVISLLNPDVPQSVAERTTAEHLGIEWCNVPLPGDSASTPADRRRILDLLTAPNAPPTLVHCAAGVNRTGLAVGLYRLHMQHWTLDQVMTELRACGFNDPPKHENLRRALAAEAAVAASRAAR